MCWKVQYEATTARSLTVGSNVLIGTNGTFQSAATGTQTGHTLSLAGNLTNNNILDFSTNSNTAGAGITFTGATNNTFSGAGAMTDLRTLTVNKGTDSSSVIEVTTSNFSVQGVTTDVAGFLTLTNGTLKISGTFTVTNRVFTAAAYTIGATTGFWLNNPNFTVAGQNGSPTNNGLLRISQGIFNAGTSSGNAMGAGAGAVFTIEGGTSNYSGRLNSANAVTYNQSGGIMNMCTVGNASSLTASFGLTSTTSLFNMSGGTINLVQINSNATAANRLDYQVSSVATVTGGTLNVGTAATSGNTGNFDFRIRGNVPNLVIDNTTNAKNVLLVAQTNTLLNTTIPAGSTVNAQSFIWLIVGDTITNNGTITLPTSGARFYFLGNGSNAQTYQGSGSCTIVTASGSVDLTMDNPLGMTINSASAGIVTQRVNFFRGGITNSNKLTLGNGGTTVGVLQYGLTGGLTTAGNFDVAPVFNIGSGGQTILWAQEPTPRTTSVEIPGSRTIVNATVNNTNGVVIAGGDLTWTPTTATSTLTFTVGNLTTNANTAIISSTATVARTSGHVIGNLKKGYSAAGSKTFEVGTANGYSPVTVNVTAGSFPGDFTVKAIQGQMPQITGTNALQRYWPLTNNITGAVANLTFNYLATDVVGTAASYVFFKNNGGTLTQVAPAAAPTTTQATVNGVSAFSDWTLAEPNAVQAGAFQFSSATYTDSETNADHTFNAVVNRVGGSDGNVSVDYQVTDGTALVSNNDYTIASPTGTLTWNSGDATPKNISITVKGDTSFEPNETVNFAISNPQGAGTSLGTPNSAVLTITNDDAPVSAGQLIISEFRLYGPNPNAAQNEFIEIYNNTNSPHTVGATDASAGYGVAASDGVLRCTIPNGTVIPARGHFLCVNSVGYSLGSYPSGNGPSDATIGNDKVLRRGVSKPREIVDDPQPNVPNATGDATYTMDIPPNAGIALFSSTTTFTLANRLDAVGSTSEGNTLYKEGTGYPALTTGGAFDSLDYAFVRDECGKGGSIPTFGPCPTGPNPKDTDNNAADFFYLDTNGISAGAGQRLGAAGPQNLGSPIQRSASFGIVNIDATVGASSPPNRVRDFTSAPAQNSTFGTLSLRKRVVNNTGAPITRLRFRIVDYTTFPAPPGIADLRARTSSLVVVSGINDAATCLAMNGSATTPCSINVEGTTIETPPSQLNGGGFNTSISAGTITLGTPLANGASISLQFLLGIQQTGTFKFFINVETLP